MRVADTTSSNLGRGIVLLAPPQKRPLPMRCMRDDEGRHTRLLAAALDKVQKEEGTELPDREGTYDELREEATKADEQSNEGEQDD